MDGYLYIDFAEDEEWRTSINEIHYKDIVGGEGILENSSYDISEQGRIKLIHFPPFEATITIKAPGYEDKTIKINEGITLPPGV